MRSGGKIGGVLWSTSCEGLLFVALDRIVLSRVNYCSEDEWRWWRIFVSIDVAKFPIDTVTASVGVTAVFEIHFCL